MKELWKAVPEWEGIYEISNRGRVKSLARLGGGPQKGPYRIRERIMRVAPSKSDTMVVTFTSGSRREYHVVGRLVLLVFSGTPDDDSNLALHRDGDFKNNHIANLFWGSQHDAEILKISRGVVAPGRASRVLDIEWRTTGIGKRVGFVT